MHAYVQWSEIERCELCIWRRCGLSPPFCFSYARTIRQGYIPAAADGDDDDDDRDDDDGGDPFSVCYQGQNQTEVGPVLLLWLLFLCDSWRTDVVLVSIMNTRCITADLRESCSLIGCQNQPRRFS